MTDDAEPEADAKRDRPSRFRQTILVWSWMTIGLTCFAAFLYAGWTRHEGDPISEAGLCIGLIAFALSVTAFVQARDWMTRAALIVGFVMLAFACLTMMTAIIHN